MDVDALWRAPGTVAPRIRALIVVACVVTAYLANEALPSIDVLQRDGYAIDAYAFPFGASNDALDAALLDYVRLVRVSPGSCPY